eukprot:TRINITY_DN23071_c0_g1_i1.p1 TRINITY_DN23071_c0_g1~~TRINITY_DN23071_c0_g1_i1.p1  ORF type:complete len:442 (-),score=56.28 TRINITY_DN23071_c0_g1_i1:288-1526(-)
MSLWSCRPDGSVSVTSLPMVSGEAQRMEALRLASLGQKDLDEEAKEAIQERRSASVRRREEAERESRRRSASRHELEARLARRREASEPPTAPAFDSASDASVGSCVARSAAHQDLRKPSSPRMARMPRPLPRVPSASHTLAGCSERSVVHPCPQKPPLHVREDLAWPVSRVLSSCDVGGAGSERLVAQPSLPKLSSHLRQEASLVVPRPPHASMRARSGRPPRPSAARAALCSPKLVTSGSSDDEQRRSTSRLRRPLNEQSTENTACTELQMKLAARRKAIDTCGEEKHEDMVKKACDLKTSRAGARDENGSQADMGPSTRGRSRPDSLRPSRRDVRSNEADTGVSELMAKLAARRKACEKHEVEIEWSIPSASCQSRPVGSLVNERCTSTIIVSPQSMGYGEKFKFAAYA